jgi:hypothetical protein
MAARTNNDLQNATQNTKVWTQSPLNSVAPEGKAIPAPLVASMITNI